MRLFTLSLLVLLLSGCTQVKDVTSAALGCDPVAHQYGYCHVPKPLPPEE